MAGHRLAEWATRTKGCPRFASEKTMTLAEELYREGFISYPRTETNKFALNDAELHALIRRQGDGRNVEGLVPPPRVHIVPEGAPVKLNPSNT